MAKATPATALVITPPDIRTIQFKIQGSAPLVINRFSAKVRDAMIATQEAGSQAKSKKVREPKDFEALYNGARHISSEGWDGVHAAAFRNACISACRGAGFMMTRAKLCIFIEPDGFDADDLTPLVRIHGEPKNVINPCRNENGVIDLRPRPTYLPWSANLRVKFDAGIMSETDVANLLARAGMQVGIGEGRPDSKKSNGIGNGLFDLV